MKTKVITLVIFGIVLYACSENNSKTPELEIITEQTDSEKNDITIVESTETITEQNQSTNSTTEKDKFHKHQLLIEKLKNSRAHKTDESEIIVEEEIETIIEQENGIENISKDDTFYKYKKVIEKLKDAKD